MSGELFVSCFSAAVFHFSFWKLPLSQQQELLVAGLCFTGKGDCLHPQLLLGRVMKQGMCKKRQRCVSKLSAFSSEQCIQLHIPEATLIHPAGTLVKSD